jgi:hypothetical protein
MSGARIVYGDEERRGSKVLVGKPEGKSLERRRGRWRYNIKMVVQDVQAWT